MQTATARRKNQAKGLRSWMTPENVSFMAMLRPLHAITDRDPMSEQMAM